MNVDIFRAIDPPVVVVVWSYPGLSAVDMERRVLIIHERASGSVVNDIERMESESLPEAGVIRSYFHPRTTTAAAIAQLNRRPNEATSLNRLSLRVLNGMPPSLRS
jgi:multidrug efflux pump subunit AcrB